jgi:hypothetical protein
MSKLIVFATYILLFFGMQLISIRLGYAIVAGKAETYLEGKIVMNNGLFLAFARSEFFRLLLPFHFSRILSSSSMLLTIATGLYFGALCERSRKYWGFTAIGAAVWILYRVLVYRLNESTDLASKSLFPSSLMLIALSGFFLWHGLRMMRKGTIA